MIQIPNKKITVELKSLNSKNFDLNARIPSQYREKELDLRNIISSSLGRGKVDLSIYVEYTGEQTSTNVNTEVVKTYMDQLRNIVNASEVELLKMAVKMPDSLKTEREEIDDEEFQAIEKAVKEALTEINSFRNDEGEALEKDLNLRISNIQELLQKVIKMDPERIDGVRERLRKGIEEIKEQADESRFDKWFNQIREVLTSQDTDSVDFLQDFKLSFLAEEIYVYTPKGDVKMLPVGSTALDFAFSIHSAIGVQCIGAKVNHKLVPISHKLRSGDQIEIITSSKQKPSEDWLNFVVTTKAKSKIKDALKDVKRKGFPDFIGVNSENGAHRIAVERYNYIRSLYSTKKNFT